MSEKLPASKNLPHRGFFSDDFDNLFEGFFRPMRFSSSDNNGNLVPAVDVIEDEKQYVVTAELPGVERKDIDVSVSDGVLTINAERKAAEEDKDDKGRIVRRESRFGKYVRSMTLGAGVNVENVKATHENGILKLVLPKSQEAKPKKIEIDIK